MAERRSLLRRLANPKSFLAEIALLLAGAGGAQAIMLLTAPLLSRLFTPGEFAGVSLLASTAAIFSRFCQLKYETAIATARNRSEMGALAAVANVVLYVFTALSLLGALALLPLLSQRLGWTGAIMFAICLPLTILFNGFINVANTWAIRWRQFKAVAANDLVRNGGSVATQAASGLIGLGSAGLMAGQTIGTFLALVAISFRGTLHELRSFAKRSSWRRRRMIAWSFRDFPFYQAPKAILNALSRNLPPILIAAYYTAHATGLFWFAFRLTLLPANLIGLSIGRVLTQRFANLRNAKKQSLTPLLVRSTLLFALPAIPIIAVMFLFGPQLFGFFLGEQWIAAGEYAVWTSIWSAAIIFGTPAQMAMTVQRKNRILLVLEILFVPGRVLPFPIFAASGDVEAAIAWCCAFGALFNIVLIIVAIIVSRGEDARLGRTAAAAS